MLKCRVEFWAVILLLGMGLSSFAEKGDLDPVFLAKELQRTKPDYVVFTPHAEAKYDDHGNEHFHVFRLKDGALGALWTMSRHEGTFTQRPVFAKSRDDGKTWSEPKCILRDPIDPETGKNMGSWSAAAISKSGRIYVLYLKHLGDCSDHERGELAIQYSDDAGETWSADTIRTLPRSFCDPEPPASIGMFPWQNAYRLSNGDVVMAMSHYWKNDAYRPKGKGWPEHQCDCEFLRFDNIDEDPAPADLKFTFLAKDDKGLRAPLFTAPTEYFCGEEPALVVLPDGRLFCVFRNTEGHVWYSVSDDFGKTWRPSEMLRYSDHGEGVRHPLAPSPMYRISKNEYVLLTNNHDGRRGDVKPHIDWNWRSPLYILKGEYRPEAHQPIWFSQPKELMNNGDVTITRKDLAMYADLTVEKDGPVLWYPDRKFFLLGRRLSPVLADMVVPPFRPQEKVDFRPALELPPGPGNPRNSEGDFIELKDGRVLYAYSRFNGSHGDDHGSAEISARYSSDGGRSWTTNDVILVRNEGAQNVMSVSFLRLQDGRIAFFYLVKNSARDLRPVIRFSSDEAKTWSAPRVCISDEQTSYYVMNNARAIQLKGGRIVLPLGRHGWDEKAKGGKGDWISAADMMTALSDDGGRTWRLGKGCLSTVDAYGRRVTTQEPGVIELQDGRVLLWARTDRGIQFAATSADGGETFGEMAPWKFYSPLAPATVERLSDGRLVAVWNDHEGHPEYRLLGPKWAGGVRVPLTIAFSSDDGASWTNRRVIEPDLNGWQCYIACREVKGNLLLGYCLKQNLAWSRLTFYPGTK